MKAAGEKIAVLTAYDYPTARILDASGIDVILVGDSCANVIMGLPDTTRISMDDMVHHTAMVARATQNALLVADMPFLSYQVTPEDALRNAGRLVHEAGAQAVKLEGPVSKFGAAIEAITHADIPVMGHLGLTPQSVHKFGGYPLQGADDEAAVRMLEDAQALEAAGCIAVVLEKVPAQLGARISKALVIPTIGIGAGPECDGQVLVMHDMLGMGLKSKFVKVYAELGVAMAEAFEDYVQEVKQGTFPSTDHSFS
jgi:3-methyl-2-oxobutanoate hydroxymethyltransferase